MAKDYNLQTTTSSVPVGPFSTTFTNLGDTFIPRTDEPFVPCNDKHDEVKREDIYRFRNSDPPYKESRETYYCKRPLGHEGDHSVLVNQKEGLIFWWRSMPTLPNQVPGWKPPQTPRKGLLARLLTGDEDSTSR